MNRHEYKSMSNNFLNSKSSPTKIGHAVDLGCVRGLGRLFTVQLFFVNFHNKNINFHEKHHFSWHIVEIAV